MKTQNYPEFKAAMGALINAEQNLIALEWACDLLAPGVPEDQLMILIHLENLRDDAMEERTRCHAIAEAVTYTDQKNIQARAVHDGGFEEEYKN